MPIVQSANPSPSKLNSSLKSFEDLLAKPAEEIIEMLDFIVGEQLIKNVSRKSSEEIADSLFYFKRGKPSISLNDYMKRIKHFTECSNEVLVLSLIYLERVLEKHCFIADKMNFHKLVFLALLTAIKYQEDDIHTNSYYARVGGVKADDLFSMELEFMELIDYKLFVEDKVFIDTVERIQCTFENHNDQCINI